MENTKTAPELKLGRIEFGAIFMSVFLGDIPAYIWHIPTIVSKCIVLPLVLLPLYWLSPGPKPRPVSLAKYIGFILIATLLLLLVLWAMPELLSLFIPRGWAYGLPIFVAMQCLYWIPRYRLGYHRTSPVAWLLLSLLVALALGVPKQLYNF